MNLQKRGCTIKKTGLIYIYTDNGILNDSPFYGAKNVQSGKIGDIIYIPAISSVDEHTKLSGPSAMRDLLIGIMTDVVEHGSAYTALEAAVQTFTNTIQDEKTSDERSLTGFEDHLNEMISSWQAKFNLTFVTPTATDLTKTMLKWDITDQVIGSAHDLGLYGSGFQRYFIFSLIQLATRYTLKKSSSQTKVFTPSLSLMLFEEPETFLHPPQQQELAENLRELSDTENWQVICATHSAHFVNRNSDDIPAIIRFQRTNGEANCFQISNSDWQNIVDSNQTLNSLAMANPTLAKKLTDEDCSPDMEALKYFIWLDYDRSSAFFADHVLLVEGPTEVVLINKLLADKKIKKLTMKPYVMDCVGKYNIHRFMNLFSKLGIMHSVLCDDDNNINEHECINMLINDSKNSVLTYAIEYIPDNLEVLLGIPSCAPHRKPQHTLYYYANNMIDETRLKSFCSLVEKCCL